MFKYINNALEETIRFLQIETKIIVSSTLPLNHQLKNKDRIFEIYKYLNADFYVNPIGGHNLYNKEDFAKNGIKLNFLEPNLTSYSQFKDISFIPGLSIIDVLMFNSKQQVQELLNQYELE